MAKQTILITVAVEWDPDVEDTDAAEFLTTVTDEVATVHTSGYSLSGPATYTVQEA